MESSDSYNILAFFKQVIIFRKNTKRFDMKRSNQGTGLQSVQVSSPVYSQVPLLLQKCHLGDEDHSPQTFLTPTRVHTPPLGIRQNDH